MRLGIIGLPQSGKTTIFNALTRGDQPTVSGGGRFEVHTAVVDVPDPRVDRLSAMYKPKKTTYAKVTYSDIAGLDTGATSGAGSASAGGASAISGALLNQLGQMDAFLLVIRAFADETVAHTAGSIDPARDLAAMLGEFTVNDQIAVERKLERLAEERKKGGGRDKAVIDREFELFTRLQARLETDETLHGFDLTAEEEKTLSGFGFLTVKPLLVVLNYGEGDDPPEIEIPDGARLVSLMGRLEMDLAQLDPSEAAEFMAEFGIAEPGLERMIRESYALLGVISFFTVGDDEVRAWTIREGASAPEAAGAIHTDLQKGFIRAEVIGVEDLVALGGMNEAKAKGKLRVEGKEYHVKDGEIVHVRFNL
jgi:GTP-binding protein YchF